MMNSLSGKKQTDTNNLLVAALFMRQLFISLCLHNIITVTKSLIDGDNNLMIDVTIEHLLVFNF